MSLYTIVFVLVTILVLAGIAAFGFLVVKLDRWIDRRERLGAESVMKSAKENNGAGGNKNADSESRVNSA